MCRQAYQRPRPTGIDLGQVERRGSVRGTAATGVEGHCPAPRVDAAPRRVRIESVVGVTKIDFPIDGGLCIQARSTATGTLAGQQLHDLAGDSRRVHESDRPRRDERRLLGRLGDDRVAGRQRGEDLPGEDRQREIPRRDARDDAPRGSPPASALAQRLVGVKRSAGAVMCGFETAPPSPSITAIEDRLEPK